MATGMHAKPGSRLAHESYVFSLLFKGGLGLAQLAAGLGLWLVPTASIQAYVTSLARLELVQDPTDPAALWIQQAMSSLPVGAVNFYAVYLIIHGVLNLGLVLALVARLRWAYPVSILALAGFVLYQIYDFFMGKSAMMLVLSGFDIIVIWLIWREWTTQMHATAP